jgi:TorA maturation chaperone TorD
MTLSRQNKRLNLLPEETARANIYGLLARLFQAPPDAALLEAIAGADEVDAEDEAIVDPWIELAYAAAVTDAESVREEYERAFARTGKARKALHHIAGLCCTLRHLIAQQKLDLSAQSRFFDCRIVPAAERLSQSLSKAPGSRFYKHVGRFAAAFFRLERAAFKCPEHAPPG